LALQGDSGKLRSPTAFPAWERARGPHRIESWVSRIARMDALEKRSFDLAAGN